MQIIDLHCDTISALFKCRQAGGLRANQLSVDIGKLEQAGSLAQFFAMYVNLEETDHPLEECLQLIDCFYQELNGNDDKIALATCYADIEKNKRLGRISAFLTIEEGEVIGGKLSNLRIFHRLGVRLMTLTWNYPNRIGFPNCRPEYQACGLTEFGRAVVAEMNQLNMIVDVSHLSDQGFYDVAACSSRPFVASHSNARTLAGHPRNLTDEMIRLLAQKGGVVGINFANHFLGDSPVSRVEDIVRHIRHIYQVGGIDVLALGSDFDGIDPRLEIAHIGQINKLTGALKASGFREGEIEKICNKNSMRVIQACLS